MSFTCAAFGDTLSYSGHSIKCKLSLKHTTGHTVTIAYKVHTMTKAYTVHTVAYHARWVGPPIYLSRY